MSATTVAETDSNNGSPIAILGVPFDNVTTADAVQRIEAMVASREPHYLVTANVDFLVQAQEDVELRRILFDAHLVLCDGTPLVWASRLLGNPLRERVAGSDLVPLLIRIAARKGFRIFFLGATPESAGKAVDNLRRQFPDLIIAGHYSPPFNPLLEMDHDDITHRIVAARPDLLFVSFGCPKQEKWIAMHYRSIGVPVSVGVGATIDFLAGQVKRAPVWMQRSGLEWTFRLAQEPRRLFRRYTKDFRVFGGKIATQWWQLQFSKRPAKQSRANGAVRSGANWQSIKLPEHLDFNAVHENVLLVDSLAADDRHCLLDASAVKFIDSTGMGLLIRLHKKMRAAGCLLILVSPGAAVQRALKLMQLQNFFDSAPDLPSAQQVIETRLREWSATVAQRSAAASGLLLWQGEITAANALDVWQKTRVHIQSAQRSGLKIDLSGVRFIDSTGVGIMVRAKKLAIRHRLNLSFINAQPAVQNVIELARLKEFLAATSPVETRTASRPLTAQSAVGTS